MDKFLWVGDEGMCNQVEKRSGRVLMGRVEAWSSQVLKRNLGFLLGRRRGEDE